MKSVVIFMLLLVTISTTQCVSVFAPTKQKVTFVSPVDSSTVKLYNEPLYDTINSIGIIKKKGTTHEVSVSAKGYKTKHQVIASKKRIAAFVPLTLPGLFFIGIPIILDCGSNKGYAYDKQIELEMPLAIKTQSSGQKHVEIEDLNFDDLNVPNVGFININKKEAGEWKDNFLEKHKQNKVLGRAEIVGNSQYFEIMDYRIHNYLYDYNYLDTVSEVFFDDNNTVTLFPVIRNPKMYSFRAPKGYSFYRRLGMDVVWQMKNSYGEIVDSVVTTVASDEFVVGSNERFICDALENSFVELLSNETFLSKTKIEKDFSSRDKELKIQPPTSIVKSADDALLASVTIKTKEGHGSGFAITNDGYILTNYHVISSSKLLQDARIVRPDGTELKATIVRFNKYRDIALLKVDSTFSKAFGFPEKKNYSPFQETITIGTPKNIGLGQSYNVGMISGERSAFQTDYIQMSMTVNGGNSGGPIFDTAGNLQGVIVSKLMGFSTEGISFAIPAYKIQEYLNLAFWQW